MTSCLLSGESDESLLMLSRCGNISAQLELTKRYFDKKNIFAKQASAPLAVLFGNWDLNHIFFTTFVQATERYEFGQAAKFSTYFLTCFRHQLISEAKSSHLFERNATVSLDEDRKSDHSDESFSLLEVLPSPGEDPMRYVDYFDECLERKDSKIKINKQAIDVARLKLYGYSFSSISELMDQSVRQCKKLYLEFLRAVKEYL